MKRISKEIQIALVAIIGIVVLYAGLQFLKGLSPVLKRRHILRVV